MLYCMAYCLPSKNEYFHILFDMTLWFDNFFKKLNFTNSKKLLKVKRSKLIKGTHKTVTGLNLSTLINFEITKTIGIS